MFAILFRKISFTLFFALFAFSFAHAQWNTKYDLRKFNLGFTMGMNVSKTRISYGTVNYDKRVKEGLREIQVGSVVGINLGMITSAKLFNNWDLRFIPGVSLQQRNFNFVYGTYTDKKKIESAYIDLPLMVKFKSDFYNNYRVYIMGGGKMSYNLISNKKADDDPSLLKIEKLDYSLEFAFGVDIYADRVKLSPEIRYSLGIRNIYVPDKTAEGAAITSLNSHTIALILNFE